MKLHLSKNRTIALCTVFALIMVLVVGYLARGFIRESVIPEYARLFYGRTVNTEYNKGLDEVRRVAPLDQIKDADKAPLECKRYYAKKFHVTMGCGKWIEEQIPFGLLMKVTLIRRRMKCRKS